MLTKRMPQRGPRPLVVGERRERCDERRGTTTNDG
jgi:hypothetical protein